MPNLNPVTSGETSSKSGAVNRLARLLQAKFPQKDKVPQVQGLMTAMRKRKRGNK
jgi:hypothetical protein